MLKLLFVLNFRSKVVHRAYPDIFCAAKWAYFHAYDKQLCQQSNHKIQSMFSVYLFVLHSSIFSYIWSISTECSIQFFGSMHCLKLTSLHYSWTVNIIWFMAVIWPYILYGFIWFFNIQNVRYIFVTIFIE